MCLIHVTLKLKIQNPALVIKFGFAQIFDQNLKFTEKYILQIPVIIQVSRVWNRLEICVSSLDIISRDAILKNRESSLKWR